MGRGDKKTAKGKRFKGSFGKSRPVTLSPAKKAVAKKLAVETSTAAEKPVKETATKAAKKSAKKEEE